MVGNLRRSFLLAIRLVRAPSPPHFLLAVDEDVAKWLGLIEKSQEYDCELLYHHPDGVAAAMALWNFEARSLTACRRTRGGDPWRLKGGGGYAKCSTSLSPAHRPQSSDNTKTFSRKLVMMTLCISMLISLHSVYVLASEGASVRRLKLDPGKEAGKTAGVILLPLPSPSNFHFQHTTNIRILHADSELL